jgi:hypothetical protein
MYFSAVLPDLMFASGSIYRGRGDQNKSCRKLWPQQWGRDRFPLLRFVRSEAGGKGGMCHDGGREKESGAKSWAEGARQ